MDASEKFFHDYLNSCSPTGKERRIDVQRLALSRSTGTDADAFAYAGRGIPTVLACIPIKYMHTTVECAHKADIAATIELLYHFIAALDFEELEREAVFGRSYLVGRANRPAAPSDSSANGEHVPAVGPAKR